MAGYIGSTPSAFTNATELKRKFVAVSGQTVFNTQYSVGSVHVYRNGVRLVDGIDYTATDGSNITLLNPANSGDDIVVISYGSFSVSGAYTKAEVDAISTGTQSFTRTGSNGDIVNFFKDSTNVGSIGSFAGALSYIVLDPRTNGSGLIGGISGTDGVIGPTNNTGSPRDNGVILGSSTNRFKDLYLSGGVYLGGTGFANHLDDYEEGTWTPTFESGTWNTQLNFRYTKIGDLVFVTGYLASPSGLASDSNYAISGLPFVANVNYNMSLLWYNGSSSTIAAGYISGSTATVQVRPIGGTVNTFTELAIQLTYRAG